MFELCQKKKRSIVMPLQYPPKSFFFGGKYPPKSYLQEFNNYVLTL